MDRGLGRELFELIDSKTCIDYSPYIVDEFVSFAFLTTNYTNLQASMRSGKRKWWVLDASVGLAYLKVQRVV